MLSVSQNNDKFTYSSEEKYKTDTTEIRPKDKAQSTVNIWEQEPGIHLLHLL